MTAQIASLAEAPSSKLKLLSNNFQLRQPLDYLIFQQQEKERQGLFDSAIKQKIRSYISFALLALMCGGTINVQAQTNLTLSKQAVDPTTGAVLTSVTSGSKIQWVITTTSTTTTEPTTTGGNIILTDTTTGGSQTYVGSSLIGPSSWTLASLTANSTLNGTTIATWNTTSNQVTAGSGGTSPIASPMIQLFGNNALVGASIYPGVTLPAPTGSGDGYKPISFTNSAGDVLEVSANHLGNALFCTNVTKAINCSSTYAQAAGMGKQIIFNIGSKVYMSNGSSSVLCYDYSQVGIGGVTAPTSCGTSAGLAFGGIGSIFVQGGNVWATSWDYGRMTCLTSSLAFCNGNDAASTYVVGYANYGYFDMIDLNSGGTVVFGARSLNASVPNYDVCVKVSGTSVIDCKTGAAISTIASGGTSYATQLPGIIASGINNIIPINDASGQTGWCDIPNLATASAACFDLNGNAITKPALPTFATSPAFFSPRYNSGQAYYSVPNSSYLLWADEENGVMYCWNWATSSSCGSVTAAEKPYGAYYLLGTGAGSGTTNACYVTTGDTGSMGFQYYQINPTLIKVPVSACLSPSVMGQYNIPDPQSNYCSPNASVTQWDTLKITSTTSAANSTAVALPSSFTVEYYAADGTTLLGTVTATPTAGSNTVTIPKPSFLNYANNKSLVIKIKGSGTASYVSVQQNYTFTGAAAPQICLQTTVTCTAAGTPISNAVTSSGNVSVANTGTSQAGLVCNPTAAITVSKTAVDLGYNGTSVGDGKVIANESIQYTIKAVESAGIAGSYLATETVPTNTSYIQATATTEGWVCTGTATGSPLAFPAGSICTQTIAVGASATVNKTFTVTANASLSGVSTISNTVVPSGSGVSCSATAPTCTVSLPVAVLPTVRLSKTTLGATKAGTFTFTVTGAAVTGSGVNTDSITTANTPVPTAYTNVLGSNTFTGSVNTSVVIAEQTTSPAYAICISGSLSSNNCAVTPASIVCVDANAPTDGNLATDNSPGLTLTSATIPTAKMVSGSAWTCNVTNNGLPRISIQKKSIGGTNTFNFTIGGVQ